MYKKQRRYKPAKKTKPNPKDPKYYFAEGDGYKNLDVVVTDHALLRYLERSVGIDVEGVRNDMKNIVSQAARIGASSVRKDGMKFEIKGRRVTTVYRVDNKKG